MTSLILYIYHYSNHKRGALHAEPSFVVYRFCPGVCAKSSFHGHAWASRCSVRAQLTSSLNTA
jgi:hypothetical protein